MLTEISTNFNNFATGVGALVGAGALVWGSLKRRWGRKDEDEDEEND